MAATIRAAEAVSERKTAWDAARESEEAASTVATAAEQRVAAVEQELEAARAEKRRVDAIRDEKRTVAEEEAVRFMECRLNRESIIAARAN